MLAETVSDGLWSVDISILLRRESRSFYENTFDFEVMWS